MKILAIETTCDETAAAVVASGPEVLSDVVYSQVSEHQPYGGVVPEICKSESSRATHMCHRRRSAKASVTPEDLSAVAVAYRPGLIGALLVGVTTAKALAWSWNLPLIGVHHLEAHLESAFLAGEEIPPPYLGVVISGGHTDMHRVDGEGLTRWLAERETMHSVKPSTRWQRSWVWAIREDPSSRKPL